MPTFAFGGVSPAIPAGKAITIALGSVPLVVPAGKAVATALGGVPLVVPAGKAVATALGGVPVVVPGGATVGVGLGGVPVAVPGGFTSTVAFGTPVVTVQGPTLVPSGFATTVAFGTPTVTLGTAAPVVVPTPTQLAGFFKVEWDALLERWQRLDEEERRLRQVAIEARGVEAEVDFVPAGLPDEDAEDERLLAAAARALVAVERRLAEVERERKRWWGVTLRELRDEASVGAAEAAKRYDEALREDDEKAILAFL